MSQHTTDETILHKIESLVHEEQRLYRPCRLAVHNQERLGKIQIELDQCWDLLRQRRARRKYGQDPDGASARPASVVERYQQ